MNFQSQNLFDAMKLAAGSDREALDLVAFFKDRAVFANVRQWAMPKMQAVSRPVFERGMWHDLIRTDVLLDPELRGVDPYKLYKAARHAHNKERAGGKFVRIELPNEIGASVIPVAIFPDDTLWRQNLKFHGIDPTQAPMISINPVTALVALRLRRVHVLCVKSVRCTPFWLGLGLLSEALHMKRLIETAGSADPLAALDAVKGGHMTGVGLRAYMEATASIETDAVMDGARLISRLIPDNLLRFIYQEDDRASKDLARKDAQWFMAALGSALQAKAGDPEASDEERLLRMRLLYAVSLLKRSGREAFRPGGYEQLTSPRRPRRNWD